MWCARGALLSALVCFSVRHSSSCFGAFLILLVRREYESVANRCGGPTESCGDRIMPSRSRIRVDCPPWGLMILQHMILSPHDSVGLWLSCGFCHLLRPFPTSAMGARVSGRAGECAPCAKSNCYPRMGIVVPKGCYLMALVCVNYFLVRKRAKTSRGAGGVLHSTRPPAVEVGRRSPRGGSGGRSVGRVIHNGL